MSKLPSIETQLRHARSDLKGAQASVLALTTQVNNYRARASRAEQEAAEWKRRFDLLLERTPKEPT